MQVVLAGNPQLWFADLLLSSAKSNQSRAMVGSSIGLVIALCL